LRRPRSAAIIQLPRRRILILIVAAFSSRSPRYTKAQFRSLAEPWADTGTSTGRLMLAVLRGLADVERDLIRTRTAEGRSAPRPKEST